MDLRWEAPYGRYRGLYPSTGRARAAPNVGTSRGHGARADLIFDAFQYREASDTSALTQTVPRRRAAPVRDVAPSHTKASEPSRRLRGSHCLVKVVIIDVPLQGNVRA